MDERGEGRKEGENMKWLWEWLYKISSKRVKRTKLLCNISIDHEYLDKAIKEAIDRIRAELTFVER
jgi:hypothetical protein